MITDRRLLAAMILAVIGLWLALGCSSDKSDSTEAPPDDPAVEAVLQEVLTEIAVRWRHADKAVLYENEFEYLQNEMSYDKYLENAKIKPLETDTLEAFKLQNAVIFGSDSAHVDVAVIFVGELGDTSRLAQQWRLFYHRDRWIRPTISTIEMQLQYNDFRREAGSAADAEENEDW